MNKTLNNKSLTIINFIIVSFFILIYLLNFYKIDITLVGVFRELLTIPFFIGQILFLIIGVKRLTGNKRHLLMMVSLLLLAVSAVVTIGSFF